MVNDYTGKAVLITGGTAGIGLGTGLAFAQAGATVYLTYKWGSQDEDLVRALFAKIHAPQPILVQADVSSEIDTETLMESIRANHEYIEAFISNVAFAPTIKGIGDMKKRALFKGIEYSAWPLIEYTQQIKLTFGRYPRYVVGISSHGPDHYYPQYDFVAVAKAIMEVMCRYLAVRLQEEDCRVNILRVAPVKTQSLISTFGTEFIDFCEKYGPQGYFVDAEEVGKSVLGLCSGLFESLSGQIVSLDKGLTFTDNCAYFYANQQELDL